MDIITCWEKSYNQLLEKLKPQVNQIMGRYKLYCLKQLTQSVDLWIAQASMLATEAGFDSAIRDEMLRDHIVFARTLKQFVPNVSK